MIPPAKFTPACWAEAKGIVILDPDGWRLDDAPDWDEPISEYEFDWRAVFCTIRMI